MSRPSVDPKERQTAVVATFRSHLSLFMWLCFQRQQPCFQRHNRWSESSWMFSENVLGECAIYLYGHKQAGSISKYIVVVHIDIVRGGPGLDGMSHLHKLEIRKRPMIGNSNTSFHVWRMISTLVVSIEHTLISCLKHISLPWLLGRGDYNDSRNSI